MEVADRRGRVWCRRGRDSRGAIRPAGMPWSRQTPYATDVVEVVDRRGLAAVLAPAAPLCSRQAAVVDLRRVVDLRTCCLPRPYGPKQKRSHKWKQPTREEAKNYAR